MKVSIIIVAYKSEGVIFDCLDSLVKYNDIGHDMEVIIVDNSPSNSLNSKLTTYYNLSFNISYIHNPKNGGFGQGNNIGARAALGELLFLLNPDTILIEPIFRYMVHEFKDKTLTAAGFRLVDLHGKDNDSVGLLPEYNYIYLPRKILNYLVITSGLLSKYIFPWGADLIVRKKDFINAGMFDESIFLCNEEPDLIHRLNVNNIKIFNKNIIHLEGHTTEVHASRFKAWLESTEFYLSKYNFSYKKFLFIFIFRNFSKLILKSIFLKNIKINRTVHSILIEEVRKLK